MAVTVIGITGPSCSGKTTLAEAFRQRDAGTVVLQQDLYFKDPSLYPPDANFCELRWLETDQFVADFMALADGKPAYVPVIDFETFQRVGTQEIRAVRQLVVEGMTIFRLPGIYERCNIRYYMDVDDFAELEERKRRRDTQERRKPKAVIDAQLAWLRSEYDNDHALRSRPDIHVVRAHEIDLITTNKGE
jgi:uridine kinase